jgi:hypothetical protein
VKPGDRRQRWNQACSIEGFIFIFITGVLIANGGKIALIIASVTLLCGLLAFKDISTGWKMKDGPSPMSKKFNVTDLKRKKGLYKTDKFWADLRNKNRNH